MDALSFGYAMNTGDLVKIDLGTPSEEDRHSSNGVIGIITEIAGNYCVVRGLDGDSYALSTKQLRKIK